MRQKNENDLYKGLAGQQLVCVVVEMGGKCVCGGCGCGVQGIVHTSTQGYSRLQSHDTTVKKRLLRRGYLMAGAVCPALDTLYVHIFEVVSTNTLMR